ncbi:hypothetical protein EVAR_23731_1 [Eumeta japonica]|uniref:Reverse transcriptase domain-containing protein n=1 Tax=Eumeta variegata TaxID=151549 RepID=A0A4C1VH65_EUMVA|nr:hypothetical protein EVAR_23731_1 [Eumeta japonica]
MYIFGFPPEVQLQRPAHTPARPPGASSGNRKSLSCPSSSAAARRERFGPSLGGRDAGFVGQETKALDKARAGRPSLQKMVNKMNDCVKKRGIKVNVGKTKVMVFERAKNTTECNILIEGEKVEQVKEFAYSGSLFTNRDKHDSDIERSGNKLIIFKVATHMIIAYC